MALPLIFFALLFTVVFNRLGLLTQLETTTLDAQMRLDEPEGESPVVIVDITQQDFERDFQGQTRPLHPGVLQQLINAVARGRPCVIGVDIDTHFAEFKNFELAKDWPPVVWAREIEETVPEVGEQLSTLDVLGGQDPALNESSGLTLLIDDSEKITRRYARLYETRRGPSPSFAWAIYKASSKAGCHGVSHTSREESTEPLLIRYSRGREGVGRSRMPASHILNFARSADWEKNSLLAGKIVIIGGSYLGDDVHDTPLGQMSGVEVIANVVESELRGGGLKPPGLLTVGLLLLFEGFLLLTLFQLFSPKKALLLCLPAIVFLALACSILTYRTFSRWAFFVPVMVGVVVAELIDMLRDRYKQEIKNRISQKTSP
ncbi:MAG TPA: CHASE2 domain-containing protein [Pyrinomonadaceae bacterium]|jgi:CHASE2 domain-containing sensor protein